MHRLPGNHYSLFYGEIWQCVCRVTARAEPPKIPQFQQLTFYNGDRFRWYYIIVRKLLLIYQTVKGSFYQNSITTKINFAHVYLIKLGIWTTAIFSFYFYRRRVVEYLHFELIFHVDYKNILIWVPKYRDYFYSILT